MSELKWHSTEVYPLIIKNGNYWQVCEGIPDTFLAALQVRNRQEGKTSWWIRQCVIEDEIGLCVVGDDDNEPAGWNIEDVEYWMPIKSPTELQNPEPSVATESASSNADDNKNFSL